MSSKNMVVGYICGDVCVLSSGEYEELCPGGPGFRPNTVTVILEGNYVRHPPDMLKLDADSHSSLRKVNG